MNRRVITRSRISLPTKSATCLSYRLRFRRDLAPHNGHLAIPHPLGSQMNHGTSDQIRIPARMALISPLENRKLGRQNQQM